MDNPFVHLDSPNDLTEGQKQYPLHRYDHQAMHTQFEILTTHSEPDYARQASYEAFLLLDRLECDLSRFISNSDVSRINRSLFQSVIISEKTAQCLHMAEKMEKKTGGAFNIKMGSIIEQLQKDYEKPVDTRFLAYTNLELDLKRYRVLLNHKHALLDLGGIAKGFAIDQMAASLQEWNIESALIHGGQSTVYAFGDYDHQSGWPVSCSNPFQKNVFKLIRLNFQALSASGLYKGLHIIDPRNGKPAGSNQAAWAIASSATEADALSTAFMIMSRKEISRVCKSNKYRGLKLIERNKKTEFFYCGNWNQ